MDMSEHESDLPIGPLSRRNLFRGVGAATMGSFAGSVLRSPQRAQAVPGGDTGDNTGKDLIVSSIMSMVPPTIRLSAAVNPNFAGHVWLVINPFTIDCQILKVNVVDASDNTIVTLDDAVKTANTGKIVYWTDEPVCNVMLFGASGNGTSVGGGTDDHAAIQAAVNAAGNGGTVYFPAATYLIEKGIACPFSNHTWLMQGATIIVALARSGPPVRTALGTADERPGVGITIGSPVESDPASPGTYKPPERDRLISIYGGTVQRVGRPLDWTWSDKEIGVQFVNVSNCTYQGFCIYGFGIGLHLLGDATGCCYSTYMPIQINDCMYGIRLEAEKRSVKHPGADPVAAQGFVKENTFLGNARVGYSVTEYTPQGGPVEYRRVRAGGYALYLTRNADLVGVPAIDGNKFIGLALENAEHGDTESAPEGAVYCNGYTNLFIGLRYEGFQQNRRDSVTDLASFIVGVGDWAEGGNIFMGGAQLTSPLRDVDAISDDYVFIGKQSHRIGGDATSSGDQLTALSAAVSGSLTAASAAVSGQVTAGSAIVSGDIRLTGRVLADGELKTDADVLVADATKHVRVGGVPVVGARRTGWPAPTGSGNRADPAEATSVEALAEIVAALIIDLRAHGLIGT